MSSVVTHYETHLAPVYVWMMGGMEHALSLGSQDLAPFLSRPGIAVDLGAGFGMHSIPLARAGHQVLAVDSSGLLLAELRKHSEGLDVTTVEADLLDFSSHLRRPADLILCMGDTLTHLESTGQVERLLRVVSGALRLGGRFIATFRDYRELPIHDQRFVPVRSDAQRILTCFLEALEGRVRVHDILHERVDGTWVMKVSSYEKLRLAPDTLLRAAEGLGMRCCIEPGPRGMLRFVAEFPN